MINKNEIQFNGCRDIYDVITYLWANYGYLLDEEFEPIKDFLCRVTENHRDMEVVCRLVSRYLDD